jgi:hypothetical protein
MPIFFLNIITFLTLSAAASLLVRFASYFRVKQ